MYVDCDDLNDADLVLFAARVIDERPTFHYGSLADLGSGIQDARFTPKSGHALRHCLRVL